MELGEAFDELKWLLHSGSGSAELAKNVLEDLKWLKSDLSVPIRGFAEISAKEKELKNQQTEDDVPSCQFPDLQEDESKSCPDDSLHVKNDDSNIQELDSSQSDPKSMDSADNASRTEEQNSVCENYTSDINANNLKEEPELSKDNDFEASSKKSSRFLKVAERTWSGGNIETPEVILKTFGNPKGYVVDKVEERTVTNESGEYVMVEQTLKSVEDPNSSKVRCFLVKKYVTKLKSQQSSENTAGGSQDSNRTNLADFSSDSSSVINLPMMAKMTKTDQSNEKCVLNENIQCVRDTKSSEQIIQQIPTTLMSRLGETSNILVSDVKTPKQSSFSVNMNETLLTPEQIGSAHNSAFVPVYNTTTGVMYYVTTPSVSQDVPELPVLHVGNNSKVIASDLNAQPVKTSYDITSNEGKRILESSVLKNSKGLPVIYLTKNGVALLMFKDDDSSSPPGIVAGAPPKKQAKSVIYADTEDNVPLLWHSGLEKGNEPEIITAEVLSDESCDLPDATNSEETTSVIHNGSSEQCRSTEPAVKIKAEPPEKPLPKEGHAITGINEIVIKKEKLEASDSGFKLGASGSIRHLVSYISKEGLLQHFKDGILIKKESTDQEMTLDSEVRGDLDGASTILITEKYDGDNDDDDVVEIETDIVQRLPEIITITEESSDDEESGIAGSQVNNYTHSPMAKHDRRPEEHSEFNSEVRVKQEYCTNSDSSLDNVSRPLAKVKEEHLEDDAMSLKINDSAVSSHEISDTENEDVAVKQVPEESEQSNLKASRQNVSEHLNHVSIKEEPPDSDESVAQSRFPITSEVTEESQIETNMENETSEVPNSIKIKNEPSDEEVSSTVAKTTDLGNSVPEKVKIEPLTASFLRNTFELISRNLPDSVSVKNELVEGMAPGKLNLNTAASNDSASHDNGAMTTGFNKSSLVNSNICGVSFPTVVSSEAIKTHDNTFSEIPHSLKGLIVKNGGTNASSTSLFSGGSFKIITLPAGKDLKQIPLIPNKILTPGKITTNPNSSTNGAHILPLKVSSANIQSLPLSSQLKSSIDSSPSAKLLSTLLNESSQSSSKSYKIKIFKVLPNKSSSVEKTPSKVSCEVSSVKTLSSDEWKKLEDSNKLGNSNTDSPLKSSLANKPAASTNEMQSREVKLLCSFVVNSPQSSQQQVKLASQPKVCKTQQTPITVFPTLFAPVQLTSIQSKIPTCPVATPTFSSILQKNQKTPTHLTVPTIPAEVAAVCTNLLPKSMGMTPSTNVVTNTLVTHPSHSVAMQDSALSGAPKPLLRTLLSNEFKPPEQANDKKEQPFSQQLPSVTSNSKESSGNVNQTSSSYSPYRNWQHCKYCSYRCQGHLTLERHVKKSHVEGLAIHECECCKKTFKSVASLISHLKSHNSDSKNKEFECSMCGKVCETEDDLIIHRRKHLKNHDFTCAICLTKFTCWKGLSRHRKKPCTPKKPATPKEPANEKGEKKKRRSRKSDPSSEIEKFPNEKETEKSSNEVENCSVEKEVEESSTEKEMEKSLSDEERIKLSNEDNKENPPHNQMIEKPSNVREMGKLLSEENSSNDDETEKLFNEKDKVGKTSSSETVECSSTETHMDFSALSAEEDEELVLQYDDKLFESDRFGELTIDTSIQDDKISASETECNGCSQPDKQHVLGPNKRKRKNSDDFSELTIDIEEEINPGKKIRTGESLSPQPIHHQSSYS